MQQPELLAWKSQGRVLDYRGHEVFCMTGGEGPPLLCLHGYPYSSWQWRHLWPTLTQRYRVIAPDMIGSGFSAKPINFGYSILAQTDLMEQLLGVLGISSVHLLAHDYGVSIAQELLARQQDGAARVQIRSALFLNGGLFPDSYRPRVEQRLLSTQGAQVALLFDEASFRRSIGALFGPGTRPADEELNNYWRLIQHNAGIHVVEKMFGFITEREKKRKRWTAALQSGLVPMRLVVGEADPTGGQALAQRYREVVSNPDVVELPGIGHFPQVEAVQAVLDAQAEFMHRVDSVWKNF